MGVSWINLLVNYGTFTERTDLLVVAIKYYFPGICHGYIKLLLK